MVKEQSGADLTKVKWDKLLELKYDGASPGKTVFYVPQLTAPVEFKFQATEETQ
eukprot:gene13993-20565_t